MTIQVNLTAKANSIRRVKYNGRDHWQVNSYTLPFDVVMNDGLYPKEQIEAHYKSLEGTLAPLGHPTVNGQFVSAFSPEGINQGHVGAWNTDAVIDGNRVKVTKMIDVEVAQRTDKGKELLERLEACERGEADPVSTSVAVFLEKQEAPKGEKYKWIANIKQIDHDAILLHEEPAASTEQGVGLMVNTASAIAVSKEEALAGETYQQKREALSRAASERYGTENTHVHIEDFDESRVVIELYGGDSERLFSVDYTITDGAVSLGTSEQPVELKRSWVKAVTNALRSIMGDNSSSKPQAQPANNEESDMTPEQIAELARVIGEQVTNAVQEKLDALVEKIDALSGNLEKLEEQFTANERAAETEKRKAVSKRLGEVVANALSGDALEEAYRKLGDAVELGGNSAGGDDAAIPSIDSYFQE